MRRFVLTLVEIAANIRRRWERSRWPTCQAVRDEWERWLPLSFFIFPGGLFLLVFIAIVALVFWINERAG